MDKSVVDKFYYVNGVNYYVDYTIKEGELDITRVQWYDEDSERWLIKDFPPLSLIKEIKRVENI